MYAAADVESTLLPNNGLYNTANLLLLLNAKRPVITHCAQVVEYGPSVGNRKGVWSTLRLDVDKVLVQQRRGRIDIYPRLALDRTGAPNSGTDLEKLGQVVLSVQSDKDATTRAQYPGKLGHGCVRIIEVVEHVVCDYNVEARVIKGQVVRVALLYDGAWYFTEFITHGRREVCKDEIKAGESMIGLLPKLAHPGTDLKYSTGLRKKIADPGVPGLAIGVPHMEGVTT